LLRLVPRRLADTPVELCRRLSYEGFEHVHAAAAEGGGLLYLVPASADRRLPDRRLPRILELFCPTGEAARTALVASADDAAAAARRARADGDAAVPTLLRPAAKGRFVVRFLPPVVARPGETEAALAGRYLAALKDAEDEA
jgi:hypothetical protein